MKVAISPCPNDTFAFAAIAMGLVPTPEPCEFIFEDIADLNDIASQGQADLCKVSFHALLDFQDQYQVLDAGSALGFGCGPLLLTRNDTPPDLSKPIAVPGMRTTATLLLQLWAKKSLVLEHVRFDKIMPAMAKGIFESGLIIHESRFTYSDFQLKCHVDLGAWWEKATGFPIPLGGIVGKRSLGSGRIQAWSDAIKNSIEFAYQNKDQIWPFVCQHATEMDSDVMQKHIDLYVNDFTRSLGEIGHQTINFLLKEAATLK